MTTKVSDKNSFVINRLSTGGGRFLITKATSRTKSTG